jgi:hypothetical protein
MKNIFLGLIFILFFLPQVSFGAPIVSPQQAACNKQLDGQSGAFFGQQAIDRGAFIKVNQDLIAKQDRIGRWKMGHRDGNHLNDGSAPADLTADEASIFAAFVAKQQSDKTAFLQKQNVAMQACLGS